jgi:hypothetical protein
MLEITRYGATHAGVVDAEFACAFCAFRSPVRIHAEGHGQGLAPYGLGDQSARAEAQRHAAASARVSARMVWEVLSCPRCGKRSDNGRRTRLLWIVFPLACAGASIGTLVVGGALLTIFGGSLGRAGEILVMAVMLSLPTAIPSVLFALVRTRAVLQLRKNADRHAVFPPTGS